MSDPLASGPRSAHDQHRERDARIEELLVAGLDHYFAGEYEHAVNVWSRVLFLDRSHARARAYIERARGAMAERQREADEWLHSGAEALERGDRQAARNLLLRAERAAGGADALALLSQLDRLDTVLAPHRTASGPAARPASPGPSHSRDPRLLWVLSGIAAGVLMAAVAAGYLWWSAEPLDVARTVVPAAQEPALPMPALCEIRLVRARRLVLEGRLHAAVDLLEQGDPDGLHRAAFDELRGSIQRRLIAAGRAAAGVPEPRR